MKKILAVFSIFSLFILASCSNNDEEDFFPPEPDSDNSTNTTEPDSDNGTWDNESTDNDTSVINDDNSTEPDDNTDTTDNEITDDDTTVIDDNDTTDPNDDSDSTDNEITDDDTTVIDDNDTTEPDNEISDNDTTDIDDNNSDDNDSTEPDNDADDDNDTDSTDIDSTDIDDNDSDDDDSTEPDSDADDDSDTGSGEDGPHECAVNPTTPCKSGNLIWSSRSASPADWDIAKSKCATYSEGKFTSGWKLPTINELRGIIQNCDKTKAGGDCQVTNECSSDSCYTNGLCNKVFGDICTPSLEHSPFGETEKLWSVTDQSNDPNTAWYVDFNNGEIGYAATNNNYEIYYRCVRTVE